MIKKINAAKVNDLFLENAYSAQISFKLKKKNSKNWSKIYKNFINFDKFAIWRKFRLQNW